MTKFDLIKAVVFRIGDARVGTATGGSTTTLTDTNLRDPSGYYDGGVLLIETSVPQARQILQWNASTKTFTFDALGDAITAGTGYVASSQKYPLDVLLRCVWQAFHDCGYRMGVNETIQTVAGVYSYDLPDGCEDVRRVEILDADGRGKPITYWRILENNLVFLDRLAPDRKLRLHYVRAPDIPPGLNDAIDPLIDFEYLTVSACLHALLWRNYKVGRDEPNTTELLNYYMQQASLLAWRKPKLMDRDPALARL